MNAAAKRDHYTPATATNRNKPRIIKLNKWQGDAKPAAKASRPIHGGVRYSASVPVIRHLMLVMDRIGYAVFCGGLSAQLAISIIAHLRSDALGKGWTFALYAVGFVLCAASVFVMMILRNLRINVEHELHSVRRQLREAMRGK